MTLTLLEELNTESPTVPSVRVPQGRSTMSAVVFKKASVGAGELNVLAPLAPVASSTMQQERPCVSTVVQVGVACRYDSLVPNLVSVCSPEEDDPPEYT